LHTIKTEGQVWVSHSTLVTQRITSPLQYAATLSDEELARDIIIFLIRERHNNILEDFLNPHNLEKSPLDLAVIFCKANTVDLLLQLGAKADIPFNTLALANTSHPKSLQMMQSLIGAGSSAKWCLKLARRTGEKHLKIILDNVDGFHYMWNTLMLAQFERDLKSMRLLFQRGATRFVDKCIINAVYDCNTVENFVQIMELLKEFNINVNCGEKSPLMLALVERRFRVAILLIHNGANPNVLYSVDGTGDVCDQDYVDVDYNVYRQQRLSLNQQPDDYTVLLERRF